MSAQLAKWLLPLTLGIGLLGLLWSGTLPDPYLTQQISPAVHRAYPWRPVLIFAGVETMEFLIVYAVVWPRSRSIMRALMGVLICLVLILAHGSVLMHAAPYQVAHWLWLCALTLGCSFYLLSNILFRKKGSS